MAGVETALLHGDTQYIDQVPNLKVNIEAKIVKCSIILHTIIQ